MVFADTEIINTQNRALLIAVFDKPKNFREETVSLIINLP